MIVENRVLPLVLPSKPINDGNSDYQPRAALLRDDMTVPFQIC